jgi:ankyrin repeat protein
MKKQLTGLRGDSHLHSAIRVGNSESVLEIISENQSEEELKELFSKQNNSGETALYIAAENGHLDIVKELIKYHDVGLASLKARNGFDAFHVAAKNGNLGMFVKFKCIQCLGVGLGSLLYTVFKVLDLLQLR